jgi:hypothetical protein
VRWTGSRLAAGPSDPMDDENTLTQVHGQLGKNGQNSAISEIGM